MDRFELTALYELSGAKALGLEFDSFADALATTGDKFLPEGAEWSRKLSFYSRLHIRDFALAQACAGGSAKAWAVFFDRFRECLYATALHISRNDGIARDLADSLAGDLYVNGPESGARRPKLASYSGRGSLEGWLKALLTHAYIDQYRSGRKCLSLEARVDLLKTFCAADVILESQDRNGRLQAAIEEAFLQRTAQERYILAAYFFDGWSLKQIALTLGVHESSVHRRMNKTIKELRKQITRTLQKAGMSTRQIEESIHAEGWKIPIDIKGLLVRSLARE